MRFQAILVLAFALTAIYTSNLGAVALGADIAVTASVLPKGFPKRDFNSSGEDTCTNRPIIEGDYAETQCPNSATRLSGGIGTKGIGLVVLVAMVL
jgi:hypothetical protein